MISQLQHVILMIYTKYFIYQKIFNSSKFSRLAESMGDENLLRHFSNLLRHFSLSHISFGTIN